MAPDAATAARIKARLKRWPEWCIVHYNEIRADCAYCLQAQMVAGELDAARDALGLQRQLRLGGEPGEAWERTLWRMRLHHHQGVSQVAAGQRARRVGKAHPVLIGKDRNFERVAGDHLQT